MVFPDDVTLVDKHKISIAAESFVAGVFAQADYSVFVQYGANKPGYDLVVSDDTTPLHVSVSVGGRSAALPRRTRRTG